MDEKLQKQLDQCYDDFRSDIYKLLKSMIFKAKSKTYIDKFFAAEVKRIKNDKYLDTQTKSKFIHIIQDVIKNDYDQLIAEYKNLQLNIDLKNVKTILGMK